MKLQTEHPFRKRLGMVVGDIDGVDSIHLVDQPVAYRDDPQFVPFPVVQFLIFIADLCDDFGFAIRSNFDTLETLGDDAPSGFFSIEHPEIFRFWMQVGLVAFECEVLRIDQFAAILHT